MSLSATTMASLVLASVLSAGAAGAIVHWLDVRTTVVCPAVARNGVNEATRRFYAPISPPLTGGRGW